MANGEFTRVRLRTVTFALLAAAAVLVGTAGPAAASNDPLFLEGKQWNLGQVNAPPAWGRSTGAGVAIGIVDTGVFLQHEDLAGKVVASANCIGSGGNAGACSGNAQDDNGHGTHVSGIAAAYKDNGRGIAGVAPDAKLVVAKALDNNGSGDPDDVIAGIRWVVQHGARVVNLSLGDDPILAQLFSDPAFPQAINDAWNAGAVPVVAGGNREVLFCGGSYGNLNALVVGATGANGAVSSYSCSLGDAKWGLVAPGGTGTDDARDVISTIFDPNHPDQTNTYAYLAGTSMATPHVSGAVALLLAEGLSRDAAVQRILSTTTAVQGCGSSTCGHGLLNVAAAAGTGPGGGGGGGGSGGGGAPAASGGGGAPKVVKAPTSATTASQGATTTAAPSTTTTLAPGELPPGDNPVVAAGRLPGQVHKNGGRPSSSRALQVGAAIALLGGAGTGLGLLLRLRGGAAP